MKMQIFVIFLKKNLKINILKITDIVKLGTITTIHIKIQKPYLTDCNLLIVQDLWQAHYQILLIILLSECIKLNVNTNTMIKNVKLEALNTIIVSAFLNAQTLKII